MTLSRLTGALLAASCTMLVLASLGAQEARSSTSCTGGAGFPFELGLADTCDHPTSLSGSSSQLSVFNSAVNGTALFGYANAATGSDTGVFGQTDSSGADTAGVVGRLSSGTPGSSSAAVFGLSLSSTANGYGVWGNHFQGTGTAPGVYGSTSSTEANSIEVKGEAAHANGVIGVSQSSAASGVYGENFAGGYGVAGRSNGDTAGGVNFAVLGDLTSTSPAAQATAVRGWNHGTNANGYGVWGSHAGGGTGVYGQSASGLGVYGEATNGIGLVGLGGTVGVVGYNPNANGFAGYFLGNVNVTGTLTKGARAFRIDHPLDPAHKYLVHSFVESPDMKNIYDGNVVTNGKGFATVKLPAYFQALNRDFRYQLTIVGTSGWRTRVVKEIVHNRFTIQSDLPRMKVSWQVTGIRHDAYANAHRIQVVVPKSGAADGKYEQTGQSFPRRASACWVSALKRRRFVTWQHSRAMMRGGETVRTMQEAEWGLEVPLVSVVFPCLNEADNIEPCVSLARSVCDRAGIPAEVIVVDNGSDDGSGELARRAGAIVVSEPRRGYGSAYLAGFDAARGDYIVMVDADLSYDLHEIPRFVAHLDQGAQLVMGNRLESIQPGAMSWLHRVGNPLLTGILNLLVGARLADVHCGMRAIRRDVLPQARVAHHRHGVRLGDGHPRDERRPAACGDPDLSAPTRRAFEAVAFPGRVAASPSDPPLQPETPLPRPGGRDDHRRKRCRSGRPDPPDAVRPTVVHPRADRRLAADHGGSSDHQPRALRPGVQRLPPPRGRPVARAHDTPHSAGARAPPRRSLHTRRRLSRRHPPRTLGRTRLRETSRRGARDRRGHLCCSRVSDHFHLFPDVDSRFASP